MANNPAQANEFRKRSFSFALALLLALLFPLLCPYAADKEEAKKPEPVATNLGPMPEFKLVGPRGRQISSAQFKGKVLIINFWATWCVPCAKEMVGLNALYRQYKDQGLEIIGVTQDPDPKDVRKFLKKRKIGYTILMSDKQIEEGLRGIPGLPTSFIIDRKGQIVKRLIGFTYQEEFEGTIKPLL